MKLEVGNKYSHSSTKSPLVAPAQSRPFDFQYREYDLPTGIYNHLKNNSSHRSVTKNCRFLVTVPGLTKTPL